MLVLLLSVPCRHTVLREVHKPERTILGTVKHGLERPPDFPCVSHGSVLCERKEEENPLSPEKML